LAEEMQFYIITIGEMLLELHTNKFLELRN